MLVDADHVVTIVSDPRTRLPPHPMRPGASLPPPAFRLWPRGPKQVSRGPAIWNEGQVERLGNSTALWDLRLV